MNRVAMRRVSSLAMLLPLLSVACDNAVLGSQALIQVTPSNVVFTNARPQAAPYTERVQVKNVGNFPLRVESVVLDATGSEQFALPEGTPTQFTLNGNESRYLDIQYTAIDLEPRTSNLIIRSNDTLNSRVQVPIRTQDLSSRIVITDCVRTEAGDGGATGNCTVPTDDLLVNFGEIRPNQCRTGTVTIENTGTSDLVVQPPTFQAGSSTDFSFDGGQPGEFTLGPVDSDGNTQKRVITIKFCSGTTTSSTGTVIFTTNDPSNPSISVTLQGEVANNTAPRCACNPSGTFPDPQNFTLEVAPQDTVNLRATCRDSENQPLQYAWTVVARPAGSTEQIRNPNSANATFVANTATSQTEPYVFRVTATDTFGSTGTCDLTVFAVPRDALHVQLVWDKDQTDVDLHFLNPTGTANPWASTGWFNSPNDDYYANRTPEWGVAGTTDNPRLDLDDTNGFGPENINLSRPQSGRFRVGVHYYCDDSVGASNATVRIFCNGALSNEFGPMRLPATGFFWEVADINWPGCTITEVNQSRTVTQGCLGGF